MKDLVVIILLMSPFVSNGQETIEPVLKVHSGTWKYVGAYLTPEFAFRTLSTNDDGQIFENIIDSRDERETYKFGYTNGLTFGFTYNRKVGLETGIQYSNMGYQSKKEELVFGDYIDPRLGFVYTVSGDNRPTHARFIHHFEYIGIPIALRYWSGTEKLRFSASLGFTASYLVKASSTLVLFYDGDSPERSKQTSETEFEKFNLTPTLGAGIEYQLNPRMHLSTMPTIIYGVLNIIDTPITGKLYSGGLQFGWYMNL
jgi:hypothetical protein